MPVRVNMSTKQTQVAAIATVALDPGVDELPGLLTDRTGDGRHS
jgi:hypothetical protein